LPGHLLFKGHGAFQPEVPVAGVEPEPEGEPEAEQELVAEQARASVLSGIPRRCRG